MFRAHQVHNYTSIWEECVQFKRKQAAELVVISSAFHSFWKPNPQSNYSSQSMQEFGTSFRSELSIHMSLSGQRFMGTNSEAFTLQLFSNAFSTSVKQRIQLPTSKAMTNYREKGTSPIRVCLFAVLL